MRTPPTREELEKSTELLFNVMTNCFAYFLWWTSVRPLLENSDLPNKSLVIKSQNNAVTEGTLLAIRKMNDFFRAEYRSNEKEDDVFSYDFRGFSAHGNFLHPEDFSEMHKRVGHITLREIRHGRVSWEIHRAVDAAAKKYIEFLEFLRLEFFAADESRKSQVATSHRVVTHFLSAMERARELDSQKKAEAS